VGFAVSFDRQVFSLDVVKRAAYCLTAEGSFDFSVTDTTINCAFTFNAPTSEEKAASLKERFKTAVLDQDLRAQIASETTALRNTILAYAFSQTKLGDAD